MPLNLAKARLPRAGQGRLAGVCLSRPTALSEIYFCGHKCAKQSLVSPVGEIPTLEGLAIHQESSLGRTVVTLESKRRQSENWAVTKVKPTWPRYQLILGSRVLVHLKTTVGTVKGNGAGDPGGVSGMARFKRRHQELGRSSSVPGIPRVCRPNGEFP